jgi:Diacylglycerol acyltransferase
VSVILIKYLHVRVFWPIAVLLWSHAIYLSPFAASLAECGMPHAGCRQWDGFRRYITANIDEALTAWFGRVEVVRDGKSEFDPQRRYMFGYAPHGLFPIGMQLSSCSCTSFLCLFFRMHIVQFGVVQSSSHRCA